MDNKGEIRQIPQSLQQPNSTSKEIPSKRQFLCASIKQSFEGPIPPPDILQKYEQICPGAASRVIKMAENQSNHRQNIERKVISSNVSNEKWGMTFSFILTSILMVSGTVLVLSNKQAAGYLALFVPSIFHAGNYVYRKYIEKEEPKKREKEIENAKKEEKRQAAKKLS